MMMTADMIQLKAREIETKDLSNTLIYLPTRGVRIVALSINSHEKAQYMYNIIGSLYCPRILFQDYLVVATAVVVSVWSW